MTIAPFNSSRRGNSHITFVCKNKYQLYKSKCYSSKKMQFKKSFWASENRQRICGGKFIDVVE